MGPFNGSAALRFQFLVPEVLFVVELCDHLRLDAVLSYFDSFFEYVNKGASPLRFKSPPGSMSKHSKAMSVTLWMEPAIS